MDGYRLLPMIKTFDLGMVYLPPDVSLLRPTNQATEGAGKPDTRQLIVTSVPVSTSALSPIVMTRGSRLSRDFVQPIDPTILVDLTTGLVGAERIKKKLSR